jgi:hypothetical protein
VRRAILTSVALVLPLGGPALAQTTDCDVLVVVFEEASLPDLLDVPELRSLAAAGGTALMNGRSDVGVSLHEAFDTPAQDPTHVPGLCMNFIEPFAGPVDAATAVEGAIPEMGDRALILVISASPSAASAADGDELGTVILARGDPASLLEGNGEPRSLTSDSTRRAGVVADVDPAATVAEWLDLPSDAGAPIERTGEPAPLDLYERYLQQRRLAVPIAAAAWGLVVVFGLAGALALRFRERLSLRTLAVAGALAASLPWLAVALLLVGHLPSLTYATVIPVLLAVVLGGVTFTRWVEARNGIFVALAACGVAVLVILGIEAAFGWPAAVTPLAGGGQLDGGRFFGMPNIEIGIVLGSALFVAHRVPTLMGAILLGVCALVAGSPWTGSNVGAAVTLFAAAGMWLAIRGRRPWWMVVLITGAITGVGAAVVAATHRFLTDRPTHVTSFLEGGDGIAGALERQLDRLQVGFDLIADTPFALIPVVGTLVLLVLVLRPPAAIARTFEGHDAWRDAVLVIVLGSIVAYLVEDTGAAAVGFGFGFALSGLLDVSLAAGREMMAR